MDDSDALRRERDARIAELEKPTRKPPAIRLPIALFAILSACLILAREAPDLVYFFSPRAPLELGTEGAYQLDGLTPNRLVKLHGVPTRRGAFARHGDETFVAVGLRGTPIVVRRRALPTEDWPPGFKTPPPVDQTPLEAEGRLVSGRSQRYREELDAVVELGELPRDERGLWLVIDADRPEHHWPSLALAVGLLAFIALNTWLALRALRFRRGS